jgi:hypothetical protein
MQAYEFYATPENGFIPIPEQYRSSIKKNVKVIVLEEKIAKPIVDTRRKSDFLLPPTMDTRGWKFNREEANER